MRNLRIANKLLVAFGGIALLLVALTWFAIAQLGSMNGLMSLAIRDRLPKVMLTDEINTAKSDFRVAEAQHILSLDAEGMSATETKLDDQKALIERDYKKLDGSLHKPEARTLLGTFRSQWDSYLAENKVLLALSRQNKSAEATATLRGKSQQDFDLLSKTAGNLAEYEAGLATASGDEGDALFGRVRTMLLVAVGLAIAALGGILVLLVRQIASPVSAITGALGDLARGKMDVAVPVDDRADEVGDLLML